MVYFAETAWERVEKVWVLPRRRVRWLKTEPNFAFATQFTHIKGILTEILEFFTGLTYTNKAD